MNKGSIIIRDKTSDGVFYGNTVKFEVIPHHIPREY